MLAAYLLDTLPKIMRQWHRVLHSGLPDGLTINQFRVLFFINSGHQSSAFLANHLGVTAAAMSKMVLSLENKNYLTKKESPQDRRQFCLNLTKKGKSLVTKVRSQVEVGMQNDLNKLNSAQQKQIQSSLILLHKVLSSDCEVS
jgi:DNA-binding MarR family transcriptional regulator